MTAPFEGPIQYAAEARPRHTAAVRYQFVDCRWDLGDRSRGRELYLEGHIPGASFLDVDDDLAAPPGVRGRHPLPDPDEFAATASRAGIGEGVFVVAYGLMGGAERLWWLLRHFGHDDCAVIDFEAWLGPLTAGEEEIEPASFEPRPRSDDTIEADELAARLGELVVVDARFAERFRGEPNPVDRVPGRIPGARQRAVERAGARATAGRARRLLRLRRHVVGDRASPRPRRPRREALPRLVERVGAAPRPSGRARLGGRALEIGQILAPAVRDLRRGEADEEHRLRRPRRPLELHRSLLE